MSAVRLGRQGVSPQPFRLPVGDLSAHLLGLSINHKFMGWALGYDNKWGRHIGYGVPAICDHPVCEESIDRGLSHVCGGEAYGGEDGCGLYFCSEHMNAEDLCVRCQKGNDPFNPKPESKEWLEHILNDNSWAEWRKNHPEKVKSHERQLQRYG